MSDRLGSFDPRVFKALLSGVFGRKPPKPEVLPPVPENRPEPPPQRGNFLDTVARVNELAEIDFGDLSPGDMIAMLTESQLHYSYYVSRVINRKDMPGRASLVGSLVLPGTIQDLMGTPLLLEGTVVSGSCVSPEGVLAVGSIKQGLMITAKVPVLSMGPAIAPDDQSNSMELYIPYIQTAVVQRQQLLPGVVNVQNNESAVTRVRPVVDWPGRKNLGIDEDATKTVIYAHNTTLGLRHKYRVNPLNGSISKNGRPMTDFKTVWDAAVHYATAYQKEQVEYNSGRCAAFAWWALKLGIAPQANQVQIIRSAGLDFDL